MTKLYGRPSLLSSPGQPFFLECWFLQQLQRQRGTSVTTFSCEPSLCATYLSQTQVAFITTNIRPVNIENIVRFSDLSLRKMSRISGVSQGAILKSYVMFVRAEIKNTGATWASNEDEHINRRLCSVGVISSAWIRDDERKPCPVMIQGRTRYSVDVTVFNKCPRSPWVNCCSHENGIWLFVWHVVTLQRLSTTPPEKDQGLGIK